MKIDKVFSDLSDEEIKSAEKALRVNEAFWEAINKEDQWTPHEAGALGLSVLGNLMDWTKDDIPALEWGVNLARLTSDTAIERNEITMDRSQAIH